LQKHEALKQQYDPQKQPIALHGLAKSQSPGLQEGEDCKLYLSVLFFSLSCQFFLSFLVSVLGTVASGGASSVTSTAAPCLRRTSSPF
jgi:hypothetical protein